MSRSILVIDDSSTIRAQLQSVLTTAGYAVSEADNGNAGLAKARSARFDLIVIDVNMPGLDGFATVVEIRKLPNYATTPVFFLTTESSKEMVEKGKKAGATAWVVKPFSPDALVKGVAKVLSK